MQRASTRKTRNAGGEGEKNDDICPARPQREHCARKKDEANPATDEAEFQKLVKAAVVESLKTKGRRKASAP